MRGREGAVQGWTEGSGRRRGAALRNFGDLGAEALVVTQIERDGTLEGPDLEMYREALAATRLDVVASGGVGMPGHLDDLANLDVGGRRVAGIIVGRALYEGTVDVADAVRRLTGPRGTP